MFSIHLIIWKIFSTLIKLKNKITKLIFLSSRVQQIFTITKNYMRSSRFVLLFNFMQNFNFFCRLKRKQNNHKNNNCIPLWIIFSQDCPPGVFFCVTYFIHIQTFFTQVSNHIFSWKKIFFYPFTFL